MAWYKAGTVSVTNGSTAVTGNLTQWVDNATQGQSFIGPDGGNYEIASITTATALTLARPYLGPTASGAAYAIMPVQGYQRDLTIQAAQLLVNYATMRDTIGAGIFPAGDVETPGFRFSGDENTGITQTGPDTFAIVVGGQVVANFNVNGFSPERILVGDGTLAAPAMGFIADPNTGFRSTGEGQLAAVTNGADNVLFDADGTTRFFGAARFADGTAAAPGMRFHLDPNTGIWRPADDTIGIVTAGVERLRVFDTGEVSIGSAEKSVRLSVTGPVTTTFAPNIYNTALTGTSSATSGSAGAGISFRGYTTGSTTLSDLAFISGIKENATSGNYAGALVLGTRPNGSGAGSFERVRIDSAGNVGINNSAPARKLDVVGDVWLRNQTFLGSSGVQNIAADTNNIYLRGAGVVFQNAAATTTYLFADGTTTLRPGLDNTTSCGHPSFRWTVVYAATGAISTSDERAKLIEENGGIPPDEWLDAWGDVQWCRFKFKDAVEAKGDDARWHVGLISQRVRDAFAALDLDATEIGLLCYDEWDEEREPIFEERQIDTKTVVIERIATGVLDAEGNIIYREVTQDRPVMGMVDTGETRITLPAGNRWSLRYDECQAMEAAWQRRELARKDAVIADLTVQMSALIAEVAALKAQ